MADIEIRVQDTLNENGVFAARDFVKGELVLVFKGEQVEKPSQTSLQIGSTQHLEGGARSWHSLNHSCNPSAYINYNDFTLRALRPIQSGEEITFNYNATEYDMQVPFECLCGAENCKKVIKGFKHLSKTGQQSMQHVAPYLQKLIYAG